MTQFYPSAEAYLQSIHRQLDAPKEDRERLLSRLSHAVSAYCDENPEATAEDIIAVFGDPARCAAELMAECDPAEVARVRRNKRRRLYSVIAVLAMLLAIMAAIFVYYDAHQIEYVDIYITEDAPDAPNTGGSIS